MGLINWVMHGLGFEDSEKQQSNVAVAEKVEKSVNIKQENIAVADESIPKNTSFGNLCWQNESNIVMLDPKTQQDIRKVVDYLKQGQSVAVNLEKISPLDKDKILNFLSGAMYGLNGTINHWHGECYLLAPEGRKVVKTDV